MVELNNELDEENGGLQWARRERISGIRNGTDRQPSGRCDESRSSNGSSCGGGPLASWPSTSHSSRHSRQPSNMSTGTAVSESEYFDNVSEMLPLVGSAEEMAQSPSDNVSETAPLVGGAEEVAQPPVSYGTADSWRHPLQRIPSEGSIKTVKALPGMTIRCHSITYAGGGRRVEGTCSIRPSATKTALDAVKSERRALRKRMQHEHNETAQQSLSFEASKSNSLPPKESYWIDIETPQRSTEELYDFLKQLRLPSFFISILSEPVNWTSEVISLRQVSLAIFQILPTDPNCDVITHVALLSMPRLLVTFSTEPSERSASGRGRLYQLVSQYMKQRERVPVHSSSGILLAWMQFHVRRSARAISELRLATVKMDEEMDANFANFEFERLVEAKNCLLRVLSVAEEQNGTVEALSVAEQGTEGLDFAHCRGALSMLRANASSNERLSGRVDKHLNELRERVMTHRENVLNQRLALLTILSAIFMPLTLLSGIWGMNFEHMPELEMEGAYPKALLGMFVLALVMVYSFHRAGWSR